MLTDLRYAWRSIRRMPAVAAVVVVSLAIGIGVNTAVFSWIELVVLRPLPGVRDSGSLHAIEPRTETGSYPGLSWREYGDLRERLTSFDALVAFRMVPFNFGEAARTERTYGLLVSDNYFSALGLTPAAGRFLRQDEVARPGAEPVVVVSHGFWTVRLGGSPDAVGRRIRVNDRDLTIVGVTPRGFQGTVLGLDFDLFVPATMAPALFPGSTELDARDQRGYAAAGRLRAGADRTQAQADLDRAMLDLARLYPATNRTMTGEVRPFWKAVHGPQQMLAGALVLLQAIVLLLLLAVCGNTANLLLARATARRQEIGVRLAIGAGPARIIRLLLTESVLLAGIGCALGAALASWATDALRAVPMIATFPIRFQTRLDGLGLTFAILLAMGCAAIFGVAPAVQMAYVDPQRAIRPGAGGPSRGTIRSLLIAAEVGLAVLVLIAAGFFVRSFRDTREIDPGFRRDGVLLAAYDLSGRRLDDRAERDFAARVIDALRAAPGVEAAAIATSVPLDIHGLPQRGFALEGRARTDGGVDTALSNVVTPAYFDVMGIPLVAGRDFTGFTDAATPPEAIVNEEFARRFVGAGETIGRRLSNRGRTYTIVGVARNSLYDSFNESPQPIVYFSFRDRPSASGEIHLRTRSGSETLLAPSVSRAVREIDASLPVYDVRTMTEHVERNLFLRRIPARMFVVLGPLLLLLAAVGIYAVVAYAVAQRTSEIGIRLALGATSRRVVAHVVGDTFRIIVAGAAFGWSIALMADLHLVRGGVRDVPILMGVPALLLAVAALACWAPARRAASVDPVVALRRSEG